MSGQNILICLDYETKDSEEISNVVVQVKFVGTFGQPLFACLSRASQGEPLALSPRGRLYCRIPHLPLMPGNYTFTVWCTVNGTLEDMVSDAGVLSVVDGDYFGTGKLPPSQVGDFLVVHSWSAEAAT